MALSAAHRRYEAKHDERPFHDGTFANWSEKPSGDHPFHHDAGVTIWVSEHNLSPDDDFI